MYSLDLACYISGLSESQILKAEKINAVQPSKQSGMKYYQFQDLIILRLISILRREGIRFAKIGMAIDYLRKVKPEESLSSLILVLKGNDIVDITDDPQYGQTVNKTLIDNSVRYLSVGTELDSSRQNIHNTVRSLQKQQKKSRAEGQVYSLEDVRTLLYGS